MEFSECCDLVGGGAVVDPVLGRGVCQSAVDRAQELAIVGQGLRGC